MKFEWVSSPPAESVLRALEGLYAAGMIGEDGRLTVMGEKVAECPVEVNIARMVSWGYITCLTSADSKLIGLAKCIGWRIRDSHSSSEILLAARFWWRRFTWVSWSTMWLVELIMIQQRLTFATRS